MTEIPLTEIGLGGAFAIIIIKEVRHWTTSLLAKKNGGGGTMLMKHEGRIASNETNIGNIKTGIKEMKDENKADHDEIKSLIINGGKGRT